MNNVKKYNLNYKIVIQDIYGNDVVLNSYLEEENKNNIHEFKDKLESLAVKINIEKTNKNTPQICKIQIYNLGETTRKKIKKSRNNTNIYRKLEVYAGYSNFITLLFKGNIVSALSYKQSVNFITEIEGGTGTYTIPNSYSNFSLTPGYDNKKILQTLTKDLKKVEIGYITNESNIFNLGKRGRTFEGNTWDILNKNNNKLDIFIDNEKIYIYNDNEINTRDYLIIDNESGLLETPKESDNYIEVKTLFEPLANLNNKITLNSEISKEYNGTYKLIGLNHNLEINKIGKKQQGITTLKLLTISKQKEVK